MKPSLYRTFGTKEELFAAILRRCLAERIAMFSAMIDQYLHAMHVTVDTW